MSGEQDCDDPLNRNNVKIRYERFKQLATARSLSGVDKRAYLRAT